MSNINNCTFASKKVFDHPQDNLEHGKKAQRFAPPSTKQAKNNIRSYNSSTVCTVRCGHNQIVSREFGQMTEKLRVLFLYNV